MTRHYQDFPETYLDLVLHFEESYKPVVLSMTLGEAIALRMDFYRYRKAITRAADGKYGEDAWADFLAQVFKHITISIKPAKGPDETPAQFILRSHPLRQQYEMKYGKAKRPREVLTITPPEPEPINSQPIDINQRPSQPEPEPEFDQVQAFLDEPIESYTPEPDEPKPEPFEPVPDKPKGYDFNKMKRLIRERQERNRG